MDSTREALSSSSTLTDSISTSFADDDSDEVKPRARLLKRPRIARGPSRKLSGRSGRFKKSWNIPYIVASTKGDKYAYCRPCNRNFSVAHGGHNDAKRH